MHSISIISGANIGAADVSERPAIGRRRGALLGGFLIVSLLLHGGLLLLPTQPQPPQPRDGGGRGTLRIRIATPAATDAATVSTPQAPPSPPARVARTAPPAPPAAEKPATEPRATAQISQPPRAAKAHSEPRPETRSEPAPEPAPTSAPTAAAATTSKRMSSTAAAESRPTDRNRKSSPSAVAARVRARLQDSLRNHFYYPSIARHRGWEGRVEVGLRVEANGRLSAIRILRTSGFAVLDHAALTSISRISQLPGAASWLGGHAIDMVLPVQYRLVDG